jgi:tetratricopeptide (TPR) repeat protein
MSRRTLVLAAVALALLGVWGLLKVQSMTRKPRVVAFSGFEGPRLKSAPPDTTLDGLWAEHTARLRLAPDARMVSAFGELRRLVNGRADSVRATARWADGGWCVAAGPDSLATLPEFPDFDDALTALERTASAMGARPAAPGDADDAEMTRALRAADALAALGRADALWREQPGSSVALRGAARASVLAAITCEDRLQQAEVLTARALATLAIARATGERGLDAEAAMLARSMGYGSSARRHAATLPATSAARAFAVRDAAALERAARAEGAGHLERWFWLHELASQRRETDWDRWWETCGADSTFPMLAGLATGLRAPRFRVDAILGSLVLDAIEADLDPREAADATWMSRAFGPQLGPQIAAFDAAIERRTGGSTATFLDREAMLAWYHGPLFTALHAIANVSLEQLGSVPASSAMARDAQQAGGGAGAEFSAWLRDHAAVLEGRRKSATIANRLARPGLLGGRVALHDFETATGSGVPPADYSNLLRSLGDRLDSRPEQRVWFGRLLLASGRDLPVAAVLLGTARGAQGGKDPRLEVWWRVSSGDTLAALALLDDPSLDSDGCVELLFRLGRSGRVSNATMVEAYRKAQRRFPPRWGLIEPYTKCLVEGGRKAEAIRALNRFLIAPPSDQWPLDPVYARARLATLLTESGRATQALTTLGEMTNGEAMVTYQAAVAAHLALDHHDAAWTVVNIARERYPYSASTRVLAAEVAWRRGDVQKAARDLGGSPEGRASVAVAGGLAEAFARSFRGRSERAGPALDALYEAVGQDVWLARGIATAAREAGDPRLAFEALSRVRPGGHHEALARAWAYQHHLMFAKQEEALAWIDGALDPKVRDAAQLVAAQEDLPELVWRWEAEGVNGDYLAVTRAAWLIERAPADPRRDAVLAFARAGEGSYLHIARYLLGDFREGELLRQARGAHKKCEIYYAAGLKAETEGRHADAIRWYTLVIETDSTRDGEYLWALTRLERYMERELRPEVLQPQAPPAGAPAA